MLNTTESHDWDGGFDDAEAGEVEGKNTSDDHDDKDNNDRLGGGEGGMSVRIATTMLTMRRSTGSPRDRAVFFVCQWLSRPT